MKILINSFFNLNELNDFELCDRDTFPKVTEFVQTVINLIQTINIIKM